MGEGEKLPVAQMRGQNEDPPILGHRPSKVLQAHDLDSREDLVERRIHRGAQLHKHEPQMLKGSAADSPPIDLRHLGKRHFEVCQRQTAPARERYVGQIPESAAQPRRGEPRKPPDDARESGEDYADRRRRSRRISTKIGMTDSTITTTTTTWT